MPPSRLSVKSKYANIHGGYIRTCEHDGRRAYVKDTSKGGSEAWIFHESRFGGNHWYFGTSLPTGRHLTSYFHSVGDGDSPEHANWKPEHLDSVKDAHALTHLHADISRLFVDQEFPHSSRSIGSIAMQITGTTKPSWIPVRHLREGDWKLFDGIEPADLLQGSIGNCWFVAAVASMAEFPKEVRRIFGSSTDLEPSGRYTLRLYDHNQDRIRNITIDEFIPCHPRRWWDEHGKPLFARPNGNEAWVLLLEKGMAKMFGSYSKLDGNHAGVAFRALTGEKNTFMWKKQGGSWTKWMLDQKGSHFKSSWPSQKISKDEFFLKLAKYDSMNFLMSASLKVVHAREHRRKDGLVEGHAYSLLQVVDVEGIRLCCLRNPWGHSIEFKGAWSDHDSMWKRFPKVRERLRPKFLEDGIFWMSWSDFVNRWDSVIVCGKSMREGKEAEEHRHYSQVGVGDLSLSKRWGDRLVRPPPAGSVIFPVKPSGLLNCPGKHGLRQHTRSVTCDLCKRLQQEGSEMFGCRTCDYDVCAACVASSAGLEKVESEPGADPPTPRFRGSSVGEAMAAPIVTKVTCPGEHELVLEKILQKGYTCDKCGERIKTGAQAFSCRTCDFDACLLCSTGAMAGVSRTSTALPAERPMVRPTAGARLCACGCGRPAFGRHSTCCTHCRGPEGPHARDCMSKAGVMESVECAAPDRESTPSPGPPPDTLLGYDGEIEGFEKLRVRSLVLCADMTPCAHDCGRPPLGQHDCEAKSRRSAPDSAFGGS